MKTVSEHLTEDELKHLMIDFWTHYFENYDPALAQPPVGQLAIFFYEKGYHAGVCSQNQAVS